MDAPWHGRVAPAHGTVCSLYRRQQFAGGIGQIAADQISCTVLLQSSSVQFPGAVPRYSTIGPISDLPAR